MATSPVFEWACVQLEKLSGMTRLQARGTLRLSLGQFGLDAETLSSRQLRVVATKVLAAELRARAISQPDEVCTALTKIPADVEAAEKSARPSPEEVFKRLGRS